MKTNIPFIITCLILIIFFILTTIYILDSSSIRDNSYREFLVSNKEEILPEHNPKGNNPILHTELVTLSSYTTNIYDKDENRVYNIKLACKNLDGTVVKSNEEFSFNNIMGNMGAQERLQKSNWI